MRADSTSWREESIQAREEDDERPAQPFPDAQEPYDPVRGPSLSSPVNAHGMADEERPQSPFMTPPLGRKNVGKHPTHDYPRRDDWYVNAGSPEHRAGHVVSQHCRREEANRHLDRHGDDDEEK